MPRKKPKRKTTLPVYLPENFSADTILDTQKYRSDEKLNVKASMYYILNTLFHMSQDRAWRDYFEKEGGFPLNASLLNDNLGKRYVTAFDLLVRHGVIERTPSYEVGVQSKLVRLTPQYAASKVVVKNLPSESSVTKRLLRLQEEREQNNQAALVRIPYIIKWFDPTRLKVDINKAHAFIELYRTKMISKIPKRLAVGRDKDDIISRINHRANNMLDTMTRLFNGEMSLTKTGKDHRLHSIISMTKKELRPLYTYDGKPLASIDLKSSQPYLLTQLMEERFWEKKGKGKKLFPEVYPKLSGIRNHKKLSDILMFGTSAEMQSGKGFQGTDFEQITWKDDFYALLVQKAAEEREEKIFPSRTSVKKKVMRILYDDGSYMDQDPGFLLFKKWFPKAAELISFFKEFSRKEKTKSDGAFNVLPIMLQRLESHLMLEVVCKEISQRLPDAPLIPVHDCILTTHDYAESVANIVREVLIRECGIEPGITTEKYTDTVTRGKLTSLAKEDIGEVLGVISSGRVSQMGIKPPLLQGVQIIPEDFQGYPGLPEFDRPNYVSFIIIPPRPR